MFGAREIVTGIDLGSAAVKLVRIQKAASGHQLLNVGIAELTEGSDADWEARSTTALRELLAAQKLRSKELGMVVAGVGGPSVHLRQVEMPLLSEAELRSSLRYESRQHLPLENIAQAALDCQVIGDTIVEKEDRQSVLMVGAPEPLVQARVRVLRGAGLEPEVVDAVPLALLNALSAGEPEAVAAGSTIAIIDLGRSSTALVLSRRGGVVYCRQVPSVSGNGKADPAQQAEALTRAFRETAQFYGQLNTRRPVDRIYLVGGGAREGDLTQRLGAATGIPAEVLDAAQHLAYSPGGNRGITPEQLTDAAPRLAVAIGLAHWGQTGV